MAIVWSSLGGPIFQKMSLYSSTMVISAHTTFVQHAVAAQEATTVPPTTESASTSRVTAMALSYVLLCLTYIFA